MCARTQEIWFFPDAAASDADAPAAPRGVILMARAAAGVSFSKKEGKHVRDSG